MPLLPSWCKCSNQMHGIQQLLGQLLPYLSFQAVELLSSSPSAEQCMSILTDHPSPWPFLAHGLPKHLGREKKDKTLHVPCRILLYLKPAAIRPLQKKKKIHKATKKNWHFWPSHCLLFALAKQANFLSWQFHCKYPSVAVYFETKHQHYLPEVNLIWFVYY